MRQGWVSITLFALGLSLFDPRSTRAQEVIEATTPTPSPTPGPNTLLSDRAEKITKRAMRVIKEDEGAVVLTLLPNGQALVNKTQIVFFRRKRARMEVIANGIVIGERKNGEGKGEILVDIDRDTIIKYPQGGDYALPMSDPNATGETDKKDEFDYLKPTEPKVKPEKDRPGYLEFGMGIFKGTMASSPSTDADIFKKPTGYGFGNTHFAYYSEYIPIGVEFNSYRGNFPTQDRNFLKINSSESVLNFTLAYRFKTMNHHHFAPMLIISSLSDNFKTNNVDEALITTKYSGLGFGVTLNYDFVSPVWKPEKSKVGFAFQQVFGEFLYYPSIQASDLGSTTSGVASRGTASSGSTGMQYRMGLTTLAYFKFIPLVKRFVFQASMGARAYSLKFQGATQVEPGNPNAIPQNGTSKENEFDYRFFFGIRIDDPIKLLFSGNEPEELDQEKKR